MRALRMACLAVFLGSVAGAQEVPPALFVDAASAGAAGPASLAISRVDVEARVFGSIAETRLTLTFANPHDRALAGDLYFPLPEGATVSGYALDVEGVMVDGVVVERRKGREVFEKIVRQGIDPGLLEWVRGSNFRTRVFPIPARGRRTVMVRYLSEVVDGPDGPAYYLPLNFREPVGEARLRVQVVKAEAMPVVRQGGPAGLDFARWQEGFVAEARLENAALAEDLVLLLPDVRAPSVLVETAPGGEVYFCIRDVPPEPERPPKAAPGRVRILWDASGSRGRTDRAREIALLRAYFAELRDTEVQADLVVFRNAAAPARPYVIRNGDYAELVAALEGVLYDGGTNIACLNPAADEREPDVYLLFSDGNGNFGVRGRPEFGRPVYAVSSDAAADHPFLRHLARRTGGEYLNLSRIDVHAAVAVLRQARLALLSVRADAIADAYPGDNAPVQGRVTVVGRLLGAAAEVALTYGVDGVAVHTARHVVSAGEAVEGDLLARFWAQNHLQDLLADPDGNAEEILSTGRRFGLATPGTSLIVLESLAQYLEHGITPPESLPEMRAQYEARMRETVSAKAAERKAKLDDVLARWQEKVAWCTKEFVYPAGFRDEPAETTAGEPEGAEPDVPLFSRIPGGRGGTAVAAAADARPTAALASLREEAAELGDEEPAGDAGAPGAAEPVILIQPWDPGTPYLEALRVAPQDEAVAVYMGRRQDYADSPAFFLDCADFFVQAGHGEMGMQVLSNVAELELESAPLLRVLGHRLAQLDELDLSARVFEDVLRFRPEEPQSHRDLALVLARRAGQDGAVDPQGDYARAVDLLWQVVAGEWDRFDGIELVALVELNRLIPLARAAGVGEFAADARFITLLDVDVRIVLTWDADLTDIDLWVTEPSGEKAYYGHPRTTIGGNLSRDFTDGYGPEEYIVRKAMVGSYRIEANYYGSSAPELAGAVTVQAEVFLNYGRPNEQRRSLTLRLRSAQETVTVGEIEF